MAHQMAHEDALWPSAIRLEPQWSKIKWAGILLIAVNSTGNWWLQSILNVLPSITHNETELDGAINNKLAQLYSSLN